jgi:phage baseplate assembly protein W
MSTQTITPVFPLEISDDGKLKIIGVSDLTYVVDQNIKMILLTRRGEAIGRPAFGVGLHDYLFENPNNIINGFTNKPALRENIISQLTTYLNYIELQKVELNFTEGNQSLQIKIQYYITDHDIASTYDLTIPVINNIQLY